MLYNLKRLNSQFCKLLTFMHVPLGLLLFLTLMDLPYLYCMHGDGLHIVTLSQRNIFGAWLLLLILRFLPNKIAFFYKATIIIVSSLVFFLDMYAVYQYGHPFNAGMLDVIISTNQNEAKEYFSQFVTYKIVISMTLSYIALAVITYWLGKKTFEKKNIVLYFLLIVVLSNLIDCAGRGVEGWSKKVSSAFSVKRLIDVGIDTYVDVKKYEEYEKLVSCGNINITKNKSDIPYVVFIIGESTSRNHMGLYGYELNTTPLLGKRMNNGELCVFKDVISHHSHTLQVMRELLTFYRRDSEKDWFYYENLFDILRSVDYRTFWLSNQEYSGVYSLDKFYSKRCDYRFFTDMRDSKDDTAMLDEKLLPALQDLDYAERNFIAIHLMGTHGDYENRYPKEFAIYSPADEVKGIDEKQKKARAAYDNAVLYNDYIVNAIIDKFSQKDAIVIYVSDHADEVYEDRDFAGHMESMGTTHMIEIPMIIWTSDIFRQKRPQLANRIACSVDRPFMTDDMIHVILDIMQIETPNYCPFYSVVNDEYKVAPRAYNSMIYEKNGKESILVKER